MFPHKVSRALVMWELCGSIPHFGIPSFSNRRQNITETSSKFTPELDILLENYTLKRKGHNAEQEKAMYKSVVSILGMALPPSLLLSVSPSLSLRFLNFL